MPPSAEGQRRGRVNHRPCPTPQQLVRGSRDARELIGSPVLVRWPRHGWVEGHISALSTGRERDDARGQMATFVVEYWTATRTSLQSVTW